MLSEHEGLSLWYGTTDAPAPEGEIPISGEVTVTIGIAPVDASNSVVVLYRVNQGPVQTVPAKWLRNDVTNNAQYFRASFPGFRAGDFFEYRAVCRCAGRQVPSPEEAKQLATSFRIGGTARLPAVGRLTSEIPVEAYEPISSRADAITPAVPMTGATSGASNPIVPWDPGLFRPILPPISLPPLKKGGLQTRKLAMRGLGVQADIPSSWFQPPLKDGIHLRWAFDRARGFPWFGYYLFRRAHRQGDPICLSRATVNLQKGPLPGNPLSTAVGTVSSDQRIDLTDDFPSPPWHTGGVVEFNLDNRGYLLFTLPRSNPAYSPARSVRVQIGFRAQAKITVVALLSGETRNGRIAAVPVAETIVLGGPGQVVTATLEFDAITEVRLGAGPAALVDLCYVPVSQDATSGWDVVPGFPYPLCLPLTHPDYPCSGAVDEDLAAARSVAAQRIQYGSPDNFTLPPAAITTTGNVSVSNGSRIVTGNGTAWHQKLAGKVLQVNGDATAYLIDAIVAPTQLVLSRPYGGVSQPQVAYRISADTFAQLHDYLDHLVSGGIAAGPMADRSVPDPVYNAGTVSVLEHSATVTGSGTSWNADLVGLSLRILGDSSGTVSLSNASVSVTGDRTNWTQDLVGLAIHIEGEETYTIATFLSPTQLTLDRPYVGGGGLRRRFTIFDRVTYTIAVVDSPTQLVLNRDYLGSSRTGKPYIVIPRPETADVGKSVPAMSGQRPLDLILLATLHPAVAQMVGLYWIDQSNAPGQDPLFAAYNYDYLIVADHSGVGELKASRLLEVLRETGFRDLDGYIVFNKKMGHTPPPPAPQDLRVYALPGATVRSADGNLLDATNSCGLRWDLGVTDEGALLPDSAVMYHLWRAWLEDDDLPAPTGKHQLITTSGPLLVREKQLSPGEEPQRPPNWPPFPLHHIDRGLQDGWHSYQVSGIDIFGRHSRNSAPATWNAWEPVPDPQPWYYLDPPLDPPPPPPVVHPSAIRLLAKLPAPPPTGVEAYALDPEDPTVLKDDAYNDWWTAFSASDWYQDLSEQARKNLIGLRVRWRWTQSHMRQAPRIREFRIYYQPGQINALLGRTVSVSAASGTTSEIATDIPNAHPVDAFQGAWLRIGSDAFRVLRSYAGTPLRLSIKSSPTYSLGMISLIRGSPVITGQGTNWGTDLTGLALRVEDQPPAYSILRVTSPNELILDRPYLGVKEAGKAYTIGGRQTRPNAPCTVSIPPPFATGTVSLVAGSATVTGSNANWGGNLEGLTFKVESEQTEYHVTEVHTIDAATQAIVLDRSYQGLTASGKAYVIYHPLFLDYTRSANWQERYFVVGYEEYVTEAVLPVSTPNGGSLHGTQAQANGSAITLLPETPGTSLPDLSGIRLPADPLSIPHLFLQNDTNHRNKSYQIVAIDNQTNTLTVDDAPNIGLAPSAWAIGWLVRQYEVFLPLPDGTYRRGLPLSTSAAEPIAYGHVGVSAADDRAHAADDPVWAQPDRGDWGDRYGNEGPVGGPAKVFRVHREPPPQPEIPVYDSDCVYATPADYHSHSYYTYRWVRAEGLRTHIFRALDDTIFQVDWNLREPPSPRRPTLDATDLQYFPGELLGSDPLITARREHVANELNQLNDFARDAAGKNQAMAHYRGLSNDSLRVLAGLSGNERAFTQLTIQPLDPDERDPEDPTQLRWRDRPGPDNPPDFPIDPNHRIYIDTLDGRSTNRYFYRSAYVDGAHNRCRELSLSSPPVYLPDVLPPRVPVITGAELSDAAVLIRWTSNRESDLAAYWIYRAQSEENARDLRLMSRVHVEAVAEAPTERLATMTWTDTGLIGGGRYYYRLVAVDTAGNVSNPSEVLRVICTDARVPDAPTWMEPVWTLIDNATGAEQPWPATGTTPPNTRPVLRIFWETAVLDPIFEVARRSRRDKVWRRIPNSLYAALTASRYQLLDEEVDPFQSYEYRLRVRTRTAVWSAEARVLRVPTP